MINQFSLLKSRRFLPLFLTQFLSAFNDNLFKNALIILITFSAADRLGVDPAMLVTAAAGVFILPFFLFSAPAGQLADKYEKPKLIRGIRAAEVALMVMAEIGFAGGGIYFLLFVLFFMGAKSSFFGPLKYSILPDMLKDNELIGANALIEAATFIAILLGTIVGGIFILKTGGVAIISLAVITTAILGWIASLYIPESTIKNPQIEITPNIFAESWRVMAHIHANRQLFNIILGISWFWLVGFMFLTHLPVYGRDVLHVDATGVTVFLTCFSIGIGLGALLCNRLLKGRITMSFARFGALGMGVFTLILCLCSGHALITFIVMVLIAASGGIYVVPLYTVLQTRAAPEYRSRAIAANNIMNAFFMVAAALVSMALLKILPGVTGLFFVLGLCNLGVAALFQGRRL